MLAASARGVGALRLAQRLVEAAADNRVDPAVERLDARDGGLGQRDGGDLSCVQQRQQFGRGPVGGVIGLHGSQPPFGAVGTVRVHVEIDLRNAFLVRLMAVAVAPGAVAQRDRR